MPSQNRVTQAEIDALLDAAETQEHIFWDKELVVSYRLPSGFTVSGRGACIDPANFDIEIGRKVAREDAANQLWQLEGYRKQLELASAIAGNEIAPEHRYRIQTPNGIWTGLIVGTVDEAISFVADDMKLSKGDLLELVVDGEVLPFDADIADYLDKEIELVATGRAV